MSLCALCGNDTHTADSLCAYHNPGTDDDWAHSNRIMCDFLHRGVVPPTPAVATDADAELVAWAA
jgi:hypothetical protein